MASDLEHDQYLRKQMREEIPLVLLCTVVAIISNQGSQGISTQVIVETAWKLCQASKDYQEKMIEEEVERQRKKRRGY